ESSVAAAPHACSAGEAVRRYAALPMSRTLDAWHESPQNTTGTENTMTKHSVTFTTSSKSSIPKLIGLALIATLIFTVVRHPGDAASWVVAIADGAGKAIDGIANFLNNVGG